MTEGLRMGTGLPPGHVGHILELDSGDGCPVMWVTATNRALSNGKFCVPAYFPTMTSGNEGGQKYKEISPLPSKPFFPGSPFLSTETGLCWLSVLHHVCVWLHL